MTTEPKLPKMPPAWARLTTDQMRAHCLACFEAGRQQADAHALLVRLRPYVDSLICYASTVDEYPPNGLARDIETYFAAYYGPPKA